MTLPDLLAADLIAWLDRCTDSVPRRVLLWLDPMSEFAGIVPLVETTLVACGVRLLALEDRAAQLPLKLDLLRLEAEGRAGLGLPLALGVRPHPLLEGRAPPGRGGWPPPPSLAGKGAGGIGPRAIVYLAGFDRADLEPRAGAPPVLWSVYDYRYRGGVWGLGALWQPGELPEPPALLAWLRSHGMRLADSGASRALTSGGAGSLLARYAARHADGDPGDWPRPLRISDVRGDLGGEPHEELRRLIRDPRAAVARWGADEAVVLERLHEAFGLDLKPGAVALKPAAGAEAMADEATVLLALGEAWDAFGAPEDFPFLGRLPADPGQRRALAAALRQEILPNDGLRAAYRRRIERLEGQYDLSLWARDREGAPAGFPGLAHRQWLRLLSDVDRAVEHGWREGRGFLLDHEQRIVSGGESRWNEEGDGCHWSTLAELAGLCRRALAAIEAAATAQTAREMVEAYATDWFQIDSLHLRVRDVCSQEPALESVREMADYAYAEYVAAVNDRFTGLVEYEAVWPPRGTAGVDAGRGRVWLDGAGQRRGVIISDALRWDLGRQIAGQMRDGCTIAPLISTLPSITPYGMTAMLPLREGEPDVKWAGGPTIKDAAGRSLAERAGRKALLEEVLASRGQSVGFVEMNALLRSRKAPAGDVVVVFDTNIDSQGHKAVESFPAVARKLVTDIRRSIEKLHGYGIPTVHVQTDHGFLLLEPDCVDALGRPEVPQAWCTKREIRWAALKPDAPAEGLITLPLPLAPEKGTLGFARGVRTLVSAEPYMHGGISLQECVIPHIVAVASIPILRALPVLEVRQTLLTGGTVAFSLRPAPVEQAPLGGVEPRRLLIALETVGEPPVRLAAKEEELRQDAPEIKNALFLGEDRKLPPGSALQLRCLDRDTGEELARVPLTLAVAWG